MGTSWSILLAAAEPPAGLARQVQGLLDGFVAELSHWDRASQLSAFNDAPAGRWLSVPSRFYHVLAAAIALARETGGAFDPTIGALVDLWGFGPAPAPATAPAPAAIEAAQARSGWERLEMDALGSRLRQPGGLRLDLSGIAKGLAVDEVAALLESFGLRAFLVEIGGELLGKGLRPDGLPWWVDIEAPPASALMPTRVALHGLSIATSGDYRRYFEEDGARYAHTLDPRSGRPSDNKLASVTVLHERCMMADALATAITVLGPEEGLAFADRKGVAALLIARAGPIHVELLSKAAAAMAE